MAHTKQTARSSSTAKCQGASATGTDHQSIRQLLAKLPKKPSVDPVPAPAKAPDQIAQPAHTTQTPQPYGCLKQDSR